MGLSVFKVKSVSGLAIVSAIVAGCGGGGGSSTPSPSPSGSGTPAASQTVGSTNCAVVGSPETIAASAGALLGSCEQYEASTAPTRAATAFKSPGSGVVSPLSYSASSGYEINLPILNSNSPKIPVPLTAPSSFDSTLGNYAGKTYRLSQGSALSTIYDHRNTLTSTGQKALDLNNSRFGVFSQFNDVTQGYYGGWALGDTQGNLPTGSVPFRGIVVGAIGPSATNTAAGTVAGFSADITIVVNFAAAGGSPVITSLQLSNIGYSSVAGSTVGAQAISSGGVVSSSSLSSTNKSISASFTTVKAGTTSAIAEGGLAGSFYGPVGAVVTELVGTVKFRTEDGRNAIGAFGSRSTASLVN
jgi:hypothetical protein